MIDLEDWIDCFSSRWTSWGVESALTDPDALAKFKQRANFDYIVLFDDDSYENNLKPWSCLLGFINRLGIPGCSFVTIAGCSSST